MAGGAGRRTCPRRPGGRAVAEGHDPRRSRARLSMAVAAVVFDVGETLVDETNMWTRVAAAGGVTPFTLMAALGATIAQGRHHDDVWEMLGIDHPAGTWCAEDWYPDARPCIERLRGAGYRVCASGNTPAFVED